MALLTIDGTALPDPVTYSAPMADMESSDSAYSESGVKYATAFARASSRLSSAGGSATPTPLPYWPR